MTDNLTINGTLRNARMIFDGDPRCPCLCGEVFGDTKGRFMDGERISTSRLKAQEDGLVFLTTYSVYKVESWA
ncbi:hypothetical protein LB521_27940 [Mesorhizobium sp. BR-1-1-8]|uniref:hypothetical protein n=1 Tax=unclassified Mesorhizobium TaxID=325217 RepID=UPI001CCBAE2D|nr:MULTISPECIES: hypothetical protein [unclassified Mesorhizobium]MBZ9973474.1 hypothetical protein [Mesorhizobium sp. BR1-1-12]MBZ9984970.1 hypothetical protein [Mesorhizobium sp. BR-1-1-8]